MIILKYFSLRLKSEFNFQFSNFHSDQDEHLYSVLLLLLFEMVSSVENVVEMVDHANQLEYYHKYSTIEHDECQLADLAV